MATISTPGVGSGLDVQSIVTQLVSLEKQPLTQLQTKATGLQTKLSAYGKVKSEMAALQDAAQALLEKGTWGSKTFTSNNTSAVTGSATADAPASAFSLQVSQLAQAQALRSGAVTAGAALGSEGRLDIQIGQWSGNSFTAGSGSAVSIDVAATDTLSDIATKINSSGAGVNAVVVKSGTQERLTIRGQNTGDEAGFRIQSFDNTGTAITDGSTGVGQLAYDNSGTAFYGMAQIQGAQNATLDIDGMPISSATNTVTDAIAGVTLNLQATTTSAAQITIGTDTTETKAKIEAFRTAYNALNTTLANYTKYDASTKTAGALQGDSTATGLQSVMRSMIGAAGPSGTSISRLSDMGLELQRDGSLTVNSTKLTSKLSNISDLKTFFEADSGSTTTDGIARRLRDFARTAVSVDGNITNRSKGLQSAISNNGKEQARVNERVARAETRLYAQFSRLDANMASLNSLSSFVSQQITTWNKTS